MVARDIDFRDQGLTHDDELLDAKRALAGGASVEITPGDVAATRLLTSMLSAGRRVYVPFLPKAHFEQTVQACRTLLERGFEPVAHLPARAVAGRDQLMEWLSALTAASVDSILMIAGDRATPAGPYKNTFDVLESGILAETGFLKLGVAGYPTGHPLADPVMLDHALKFKIEYARQTGTEMWIVSQFAFGSTEIIAWIERLRSKGCELPVYVGLAGPTNLRRLISFAAHCGVEASMRTLSRRPGTVRLLNRWTPDGLVHDLARYRVTHPDSPFCGIHVFTFGGLEDSARWLRKLCAYAESTTMENAGAA